MSDLGVIADSPSLRRSESDEAIHASASCEMDCFAALAMTGRVLWSLRLTRRLDPLFSAFTGHNVYRRHCEKRSDEAIQFCFLRHGGNGLLHIACHRAR